MQFGKPEKYTFIWQNGNIAHIIANSVLHASEYCAGIYGNIQFAYISHRTIVKRDFKESNMVILDGIQPCDVMTEPLKNLIGTFSHTKHK